MTTKGKQSFSVRGLKEALKAAKEARWELYGSIDTETNRQRRRDLEDFIGTAQRSIAARRIHK